MDNFLKLGQQAYQKYSDSQSHDPHRNSGGNDGGNGFGVMGGAHLNRPAGGQMIDTDGDGIPDFEQAAAHASQHSGDSGDSSLFSTAISFLKSKRDDDDDDVDEHEVTKAHDRAYNQKQGASLDAKSMGAAAALQAFKKFTSHDDSQSHSKNDKDIQSKLIGMAMAQAAQLFDSNGGAAAGQKQDAVNSAGKMVMKLMMKQKLQQMGGGGSSGGGGGLGGLAGMLGKFA